MAEIERQQRDLEAKRQVLVETMEQARRLAEWLDDENSGDDAPRTAEGYRWRIRFCEEERFIEGAIPYKEGCEDDFLAAAVEHLDYCERQGVGATFQEAYRVDASHVAEGDYAAGLCAEARVPAGRLRPIASASSRREPTCSCSTESIFRRSCRRRAAGRMPRRLGNRTLCLRRTTRCGRLHERKAGGFQAICTTSFFQRMRAARPMRSTPRRL